MLLINHPRININFTYPRTIFDVLFVSEYDFNARKYAIFGEKSRPMDDTVVLPIINSLLNSSKISTELLNSIDANGVSLI